MATLKLKKDEEESPFVPDFDKDAMYAEVGGVEGVYYLQGRNYFARGGQYVREAPQAQWMAPETPEQRRNRQMQTIKNKKFFHKPVAPAVVPESIINAERENAQARAAEIHAA